MKRKNRKAIHSRSRLKRRKGKQSNYSTWKAFRKCAELYGCYCFLKDFGEYVLKFLILVLEHLYKWIPFILEILKTLVSALSYFNKKEFFYGLYSD